MTFYLANDGDFYTNDGRCMGSYLELVVQGVEAMQDGSVIFNTLVIHSLVHGDDPEPMGWETRSKGLFNILTTKLNTNKLNHISTKLRNFLGLKLISPRVNHSELPIYYR